MTESTSAPVQAQGQPSTPQKQASSAAGSKKKAAGAKKSASSHQSNHPKYADMIKAAIVQLNDRGGSSRSAILKYIFANYKVEPQSANQHLKVALKNGLKTNYFRQTKGTGASGSFKLGTATSSGKKVTKKKSVKSTTGSPKKTAVAKKEINIIDKRRKTKKSLIRNQQTINVTIETKGST